MATPRRFNFNPRVLYSSPGNFNYEHLGPIPSIISTIVLSWRVRCTYLVMEQWVETYHKRGVNKIKYLKMINQEKLVCTLRQFFCHHQARHHCSSCCIRFPEYQKKIKIHQTFLVHWSSVVLPEDGLSFLAKTLQIVHCHKFPGSPMQLKKLFSFDIIKLLLIMSASNKIVKVELRVHT